MKKIVTSLASMFLFAGFISGCASGPAVKRQEYAKLSTQKVFENDMSTVWRAIEKATSGYKVTERDPDDLSPLELRKTKEISLETDWIYSRSRDKYHEYSVNGSPRKQYLQTRLRYFVKATAVMGGVQVAVDTEEEIERLNEDGSPDGYSAVEEADTSRANELLEKIGLSILSAAP